MKYICKSVEETQALAADVAKALCGGETLLLNGDLGAGKTTFTKGLARAIGVTATVLSPTFTIIKEYCGARLDLYHIDMYRIENEGDTAELGLDECFSPRAVTVIEWNKIKKLYGKVIRIDISVLDNGTREFEILGL